MLFSVFLIIDLSILIPEIVAQIFNPITELVISIRVPIKEAKAENETNPVTQKLK